jgi:hypothetical protein
LALEVGLVKRYIAEFPGYFTDEDLKAMQAEFDAGAFEGETDEQRSNRAFLVLSRYEQKKQQPDVQ